ncbi:MAG: ribonuclease E activity regulator RraA [Spirochaetaceae bacterium]|nr:ribonuclease E activity regulator RraA [Spirochaetaceae bacterium]
MPIRTADLFDEQGEAWQSGPLQWRSFGGRTQFDGVISTVQCRDDNALVRAALSEPGEARVLVVDGGGSLHSALVGDVLGGLAVTNGWAAIIVHGAVRDVVALADLDVGVLGLGTNPRRGGRDGTGVRDVPVTFGGIRWVPGARLHADEDGLLVGTGPDNDVHI